MKTNTWTYYGNTVIDEKGQNVCTKETAPLIAAAPTMMAALQKLMDYMEDTQAKTGVVMDWGIEIARAAILKAAPQG